MIWRLCLQDVLWNIGKLPRERIPTLSGTVTLAADRPMRDISVAMLVDFTVPMHSSSGLKISSMHLENEDYKPYKGVRSTTQAGIFEVRT